MMTLQPEHRPMATLIALLGGSAVIHAVRPQVFEPLIPPALGNPRGWVYASGVAEALCVGLLAAPATRRWGGWASTAVLIGVFPGNLYAVQVAGPSRVKRAAALVRLPLQVPMIRAALTVARARKPSFAMPVTQRRRRVEEVTMNCITSS